MAEKKTRLNLQIPKVVKDQLSELEEKSGATSLTEVIRRSLSFYDVLIDHVNEGGEVIFVRKDGTEEKLRIL